MDEQGVASGGTVARRRGGSWKFAQGPTKSLAGNYSYFIRPLGMRDYSVGTDFKFLDYNEVFSVLLICHLYSTFPFTSRVYCLLQSVGQW